MVRQGDQTVEELMAPWCKEIRVEGHWGDPVTEQEKKEFIDEQFQIEKDLCMDDPDFVAFLESGKEPDFEEYYKEHGEDYNENAWRKDENGVWRHWIEWVYNPEGIWDHYVIGYQDGIMPFKTGQGVFSDVALKGRILNLRDFDFDSILLNGEWIDVSGRVYDFIKDLPDSAELVSIYYHF